MEPEEKIQIELPESSVPIKLNAVFRATEDQLTVETYTAKDFLVFQLQILKGQIAESKKISAKEKAIVKNIDRSLEFLVLKVDKLTFVKIEPEKRGVSFTYSYIKDCDYIEGEAEELLESPGYPIPYLVTSLLYPGERLKEKEQKRRHTKYAIHTVSQFYGDNKQLSLFSDAKIETFKRATGLTITNRPNSYGVVLNQSQSRVLEGILKAFTDTNYKGDVQIPKDYYSEKEHPVNKIVLAYSNVDKIPVVRLTQAEIIRLSGYNTTHSDKQEVIEAINFLATTQFCFYWTRTKKDEKGKGIVKDKKGDYVKEEVMEIGSLFRIKFVRNEEGRLEYYEIHPSAPVLDQVESYFLLVPENWREEVKEITGKRGSNYTYELLLWLRLQYEQIRRYNKNKGRNKKLRPMHINQAWEDMAIALKMPESIYKANRKKAVKIIQEAYAVAIKLGYLKKVENNGAIDTLFLNEKYYPSPGELI